METRIVTLLWPMNCFLPSKHCTSGFVLLLGSIIYQWEWSSTVVKVLQVKPCNSSNLFIPCTLYTVIFNWVTYGIRDCSGFCLLKLRWLITPENLYAYSVDQISNWKTNRDILARIFLRLKQFACFIFSSHKLMAMPNLALSGCCN